MYRLLIVDDEPMIVDWIYELFMGMKELNMDIYRAYSGIEALDWLNRAKIDIVISDIRMPGMSGLELLDAIHKNWPQCRVIFLTAFNDFDYVYTAIKYEGVKYILKTEGDGRIVDEVKGAIEEIEKSLKLDQLIDKAKKQMEATLPLLQKEFLLELFHDKNIQKDEIQNQFTAMDIPLDLGCPVVLLVGRLDNWFETVSSTEKAEKVYAIQAIVDNFLSPYVTSFFVPAEEAILVWIVQPKESDQDDPWNRMLLFVQGALESIQKACSASLDETISFAMSKNHLEWESLSMEYTSLKLLINDIIGYGKSVVLTEDSLAGCEDGQIENQKVKLQLQKLKKLEILLESGQREEFFKEFAEIERNLTSFENLSYNMTSEIYYSIALIFLSYMNERRHLKRFALNEDLSKLMKMEIHSKNEIFQYFKKCALNIFEELNSDQSNRTKSIILKVQDYIQDHLSQDLSLVRIAEVVYLNPIYLSRLYKQITGVNLSDYINSARFNMAEKLLKETNMKIHEIAAAVGYESTPYFIRHFKKHTNMPPQEYRESLRLDVKQVNKKQ